MESQQDRKPSNPCEQPRPAEVPPPAPKKRFRLVKLEERITPKNHRRVGSISTEATYNSLY